MDPILEGLNPEQQAAVQCTEGPVLIVAGAGSGKTRVLTTRIAWLIGRGGTDPARILALTFTKKAAGEMKERVAALVGERQARRIWMGTFHSVFIRFLREYADRLGYPAAFTIYDQSDSQSAIRSCIRQLGLDDKNTYKPKEVQSRISMAKNGLYTAAWYAADEKIRETDRLQKKPELYRIFQLYEQTCRQNGVMDFDDILLNTNLLLKMAPDACDAISARFDHILVDEYQDTNMAQYKILQQLAKGHQNICVVGDDSQSIYAFRGANIGNILGFQKDYPRCRVFRLERNYRSTQVIVGASNSLIAKNEGRIPKVCRAALGEDGEKIRLIKAFDEATEASLVVGAILSRMREEKAAYRDFAVLYRTNAQSRALEEALRRRNLPYMIYSGNSFFERAEVKDMMAYIKLVVNPSDDESFRRAVNKPARGIGETSVHALEEAARSAGVSLLAAASLENLESFGLRGAAVTKIRSFTAMILRLHELVPVTDAYDLVTRIADESGLYLFYKSDNSIEGQARTANVEELVSSVARFSDTRKADRRADLLAEGQYDDETDIPEDAVGTVLLGDFLEDISLLSNADTSAPDDDTNRIALMTAHAAKGLEFPHVIVVGMEENLFPSMSMLFRPQDIEEERRLFYVAMTRAMKTVTFTYCESRMRNGRHESNSPSRFLREMDAQYIENPLRREDGFASGGGFFQRASWAGGSRRPAFSGDHDDSDRDPALDRRQRELSSAVRIIPRTPRPATEKTGPAKAATGSQHRSGLGAARAGGIPQSQSGLGAGASASPLHTIQSLRNRPLPEKIPDEEFQPVTMDKILPGGRVEHNRFGLGTVLEVSGRIPDLKARIRFDQYGEKILLLKFAKLRLAD